MNRRDFVTKLLGVSAATVAAPIVAETVKNDALAATLAPIAPKVTIKPIPIRGDAILTGNEGRLYFHEEDSLRRMYQDQASGLLRDRVDRLVFKMLTDG